MLQRIRTAGIALAFLAWLSWLGVQAFLRGRFPVVSHAQLLMADIDVVARVEAGADGRPVAEVVVTQVQWPESRRRLAGQSISVAGLSTAAGFVGAGEYLIPVVVTADGSYRVAVPEAATGQVAWIYPATPVVLAQQADYRNK